MEPAIVEKDREDLEKYLLGLNLKLSGSRKANLRDENLIVDDSNDPQLIQSFHDFFQ